MTIAKTGRKVKALAGHPERVLHVVATSHLDTQWRWTYQDTIKRYIPATLRENFAHFRRFPNYTFSFEGAFRYMLAKEYEPELYAELKEWVAKGRWRVCGASVDAGDVNTVAPESILRQVLYGNGFFLREFGTVSRDIFLPDCFGFGWALPSVAAHCGVLGFSTSKLEWGPAHPIPFKVGFWEGVDGNGLVAALDPGQYSLPLREEALERDPKWIETIDETGRASGVGVGFKYFGLGDTGGAPDAESIERLERAIATPGPIAVRSSGADDLFRELTAEQVAALPRWRDELQLTEHGVGTFTANGAMKRWNRQCEQLADAAERAAATADLLGALPCDRERIERAWVRFLANQMHDILPGTCIPEAYFFAWDDLLASLNEFAAVHETAVGAIAARLDTSGSGTPLVVHNALSHERHDPVEAIVRLGVREPKSLGVEAPSGELLPAQVLGRAPNRSSHWRVLFEAQCPADSFSVFRVVTEAKKKKAESALKVSKTGLSNEFLDVRIDDEGNITQVVDLETGTEWLSEPLRLEMLETAPKEWPAWTIQHAHLAREPKALLGAPTEVRVVERGPVRVAVETVRSACGSTVRQIVRLARNARRVEVETEIEWRSHGTLLKAAFPLNARPEKAHYDLGLGVIERGVNTPRQHESPALQWAALYDNASRYTVGILTDSKHGWDRPKKNTLRLTLVHTPKMTGFHCHLGGAEFVDHFTDQAELDFGRHRTRFALVGAPGDWREAELVAHGARFNQPLRPFTVPTGKGPLGRTLQTAQIEGSGGAIVAIKASEPRENAPPRWIVRVRETEGRPQRGLRLRMASPIQTAEETNGFEEHLAALRPSNGAVVFDLQPFALKTFALTLNGATLDAPTVLSVPVALPFNRNAVSPNANRMDGDLDGNGRSFPAEDFPAEVVSQGVRFLLGGTTYREANALVPSEQELPLPHRNGGTLHLLAAGTHHGTESVLNVQWGKTRRRLVVPSVFARLTGFATMPEWMAAQSQLAHFLDAPPLDGLPVALSSAYHHSRASGADVVCEPCRIWHLMLKIPRGVESLTLDCAGDVAVFAASLAEGPPLARAAAPSHG